MRIIATSPWFLNHVVTTTPHKHEFVGRVATVDLYMVKHTKVLFFATDNARAIRLVSTGNYWASNTRYAFLPPYPDSTDTSMRPYYEAVVDLCTKLGLSHLLPDTPVCAAT